jgi:hypothetical protein
MSLATFKKKSINKYSNATQKSAKTTNQSWLYAGPYGKPNSLASTLFKDSFQTQSAGFSVTGPYRNVSIPNKLFSQSGTPYRGAYPKGWGGTFGRYPDNRDNQLLNITPVETGVAIQNNIVKPPVLSTKGMLDRRFRWIHSGKYPAFWVQPIYTGFQTDNASQGLYIHEKSSANNIHYNVNDVQKYENNCKTCGPFGYNKTPASGYTMNLIQRNAPYTKNILQPRDASTYLSHMQRQCQNPTGAQKPFPYAVQNGTGILRGGINVNNVANACNTSEYVTEPPLWYTRV